MISFVIVYDGNCSSTRKTSGVGGCCCRSRVQWCFSGRKPDTTRALPKNTREREAIRKMKNKLGCVKKLRLLRAVGVFCTFLVACLFYLSLIVTLTSIVDVGQWAQGRLMQQAKGSVGRLTHLIKKGTEENMFKLELLFYRYFGNNWKY